MASGKSRIAETFRELRARNEAALIPYVVAGDPNLDATRALVLEFARRGADLIELGVPFSDPMADGPANQRASQRGLKSGASLAAILSMVSELRKESEIPVILFGYFNPIFHYGCERFCADAARAGIDALLTVDLPPDEAAELQKPAHANGLDLIYLLAPTTPIERARHVVRSASGFIYYVAVTGVTGARATLPSDLEEQVTRMRSVTDLPIGVGFGISTPEQAGDVGRFADAVVVGSAISLLVEANAESSELVTKVSELVGSMKLAIKGARPAADSAAAR
ncbi:MAG TPA: tryptophan synthase subunit alpha [Candidatus Binataceae bacterium]|nr:tryptophan synthase subunit alpha [Candidatus Binataceae bacterium]